MGALLTPRKKHYYPHVIVPNFHSRSNCLRVGRAVQKHLGAAEAQSPYDRGRG